MNRPVILLYTVLAVVLLSAPASAQHLYFSTGSNVCYPGFATAGDYHVYVHSPDDNGFIGATFTLELDPFAWTDLVSFTPAAGVAVVSFDMAPGTGASPLTAVIDLLWSPRALDHEPVLTLTFRSAAGLGYAADIYDASLVRSGGGSEPATGVTTEFVMVDCFDPFLWVDLPSVIIVPIGTQTATPFSWTVVFFAPVGSNLVFSDELGWLQSWSPSSVWGSDNCGDCFFDWAPGEFSVLVPANIPPGTESTLTISAPQFGSETTVTLRADAPVPLQPSTWGRIKTMYR